MKKEKPSSNHKLRAARLAKSWTLAVAAEHANVSLEAYARWEYGTQRPRLSSLQLLCEGFGKTAEELGYENLTSPTPAEDDGISPGQVSEATRSEEREGSFSLNRGLPLVQQERSMPFSELQTHVEQVLRSFFSMEQLSRRSLITMLMSVPAAAFDVTSPEKTALLRDDEILSLCAVNIPLAWRLYFAGGLGEVREMLPSYLNKLSAMAQHPSRYQQRAAGLASQAHQLSYLVALQKQNFGVALGHARQAFQYANIADDNNLRLASLIRQGNMFFTMKRPTQTLIKYQEAIQHSHQASPLLLGQAYIGLAEAYARIGQKKEAQHFQGLALETFPTQPEDELHHAYTHFNHFTRVNFEGLMYIHLGQPKAAWDAFAEIEKDIPATLAPQKVELITRQALSLATMGDMPQSCEYLELAAMAALKLGSELRYNEACEIYEQIRLQWPHESRVKTLEELFHQHEI